MCVSTYGYELAQAVKDGYLVDFLSVESSLKFIEQGIVYDKLSEEDKEAYEETFENENGEFPEKISSSALDSWLFNEDTIKKVLHILMNKGIRINYGETLGKTIIFAKNHDMRKDSGNIWKSLSVFVGICWIPESMCRKY